MLETLILGASHENAGSIPAPATPELDALLSMWHWWQRGSVATRGYASRSLVCADYQTSRQYDDQNGALDDALTHRRCLAVDFAANQMQDPWRAAIYVVARNLCTGVESWTNPRIPAGHEVTITSAAKTQITKRLVSAGVL